MYSLITLLKNKYFLGTISITVGFLLVINYFFDFAANYTKRVFISNTYDQILNNIDLIVRIIILIFVIAIVIN